MKESRKVLKVILPRKIIASLLVAAGMLLAGLHSTDALTPGQRVALFGGQHLAFDANFAATQACAPLCPGGLTFSQTTPSTMFNSSGLLTYAPNNLLVHTNGSSGWSVSQATATPGQADPDGGTNAVLVTDASGAGIIPLWFQGPTISGSGTTANYFFGVKFKAGTLGYATLRVLGTGSAAVVFNLTTGAANVITGTYVLSAPAATSLGNGWWYAYVIVSNSIGLSTGQLYAEFGPNNGGGSTSYNGTGTGTIYAYNPQESLTLGTQVPSSISNLTGASAYFGPRYDYGCALPQVQSCGLLVEQASTNLALWSRDLTNAAWTKTSGTAAKDQTGIDGVSNSASSFLATAGNATVLQTITQASTSDTYSPWIKRIAGTGEVDITLDGGTTWTNVTSLINSSTYTRVSENQTVTNASFGVRLVTSGDKVAIDANQVEALGFYTSPIPTGASQVSRAADVAFIQVSNIGLAGTLLAKWIAAQPLGTFIGAADLSDGTGNNDIQIGANNSTNPIFEITAVNGTDRYISRANGTLSGQGLVNRQALAWDAASASSILNGTIANKGALSGNPPSTAITKLYIGTLNASTSQMGNKWVERVTLYPRRMNDSFVQSQSAGGY